MAVRKRLGLLRRLDPRPPRRHRTGVAADGVGSSGRAHRRRCRRAWSGAPAGRPGRPRPGPEGREKRHRRRSVRRAGGLDRRPCCTGRRRSGRSPPPARAQGAARWLRWHRSSRLLGGVALASRSVRRRTVRPGAVGLLEYVDARRQRHRRLGIGQVEREHQTVGAVRCRRRQQQLLVGDLRRLGHRSSEPRVSSPERDQSLMEVDLPPRWCARPRPVCPGQIRTGRISLARSRMGQIGMRGVNWPRSRCAR